MRSFPTKVRAAAFARSQGRCEGCGRALAPGDIHYDHRNPHALSRDSSLSNCQVLCRACHADKTAQRDIPAIARVVRIGDKHRSAHRAGRRMAAGRHSKLRKTIAGAVVPRVSQAEAHREFISRRYGRTHEGRDDEA